VLPQQPRSALYRRSNSFASTTPSRRHLQPFGPRFGVGDVVGCGIVYCGATDAVPYVPRRQAVVAVTAGGSGADAAPHPVLAGGAAGAGAPPPGNADAGSNEDDGAGPPRRLEFGKRPITRSRAEPHEEDALLGVWDRSRPTLFYTLNGRLMGPAFSIDATRRWYPTVGIDCPEAISFNFGSEPFAYDVGRLSRRLWGDCVIRGHLFFGPAGEAAGPTRPSVAVFGVADDDVAAARSQSEPDRVAAAVRISLDAAVRDWRSGVAAWMERRRRLRHLHTLLPRRKGALASSLAGVDGAGAGGATGAGSGSDDVEMTDVTAAGAGDGAGHGSPVGGISGGGDGGSGGGGSGGSGSDASSGPAPPLNKRSRTLSAGDDAGGTGRPSPPADPASVAAGDAAAAAAVTSSGAADLTDEDDGGDDSASGEWQLRPQRRNVFAAFFDQLLEGGQGAGGVVAELGEHDDDEDIDEDDEDDMFDDEDDEDEEEDADADDDGGDWFDEAGDGDGDGDDLSLPSLGPEEKDMLRRAILRAAETGAIGDHERAIAHALAQDDYFAGGAGAAGGGAAGAGGGGGAAGAPMPAAPAASAAAGAPATRGGVPIALPQLQQQRAPAAAAGAAAGVPPPQPGAALQLGMPPPPPSAAAGGRVGVPPAAPAGGSSIARHPLSRVSRASASSDGAVSTDGDAFEASAASAGGSGGGSSSAAAISMLLPTSLRLTGGRVSGGAGGNTPLPAPATHGGIGSHSAGGGGGVPPPPDDGGDDDDDDSDVRSVISRS
jgi:hypothetical protein